MRARYAWPALIGAVTVYEIVADDHELLTAAVRRARDRHPAIDAAVTSSIVITALHLLDALGPLDPFRLLSVLR